MGFKGVNDPEVQGWIDEAVDEYATDLQDTMKRIVHVVTGNLRDSITKEKVGKSIDVGVDADKLIAGSDAKDGFDYSIVYYHGRNGSKWAGHKFLEQAMNEVKK